MNVCLLYPNWLWKKLECIPKNSKDTHTESLSTHLPMMTTGPCTFSFVDFWKWPAWIEDGHNLVGPRWLFRPSVMSDSFATPWTVTHQAPLSTGFSRQEYWSELPFSSPGDILDPGIKPMSPALAGRFFTTEPPGKPIGSLLHANNFYGISFNYQNSPMREHSFCQPRFID